MGYLYDDGMVRGVFCDDDIRWGVVMDGMSDHSISIDDFANRIMAELKRLYPDDDIQFTSPKEMNSFVENEDWADVPLIVVRWQSGGEEQTLSYNIGMNFEQFQSDGDFEQSLVGIKRMREEEI